jgi:hypothetical protein
MFAVWLSFCAVICVQKLLQKEYKSIVRYMLFFCSGIAITLLPVLLYLKVTGTLEDCIDQYIVFNKIYMSNSYNSFLYYIKNFTIAMDQMRISVFFVIVLAWLLLEKPSVSKYGFYVAYAISWVVSFLLIMLPRRNYNHYYMVLIPLFVPAVSFCTGKLFTLFHHTPTIKTKYGAPLLLLCVFFYTQILYGLYGIEVNINSDERVYFFELGTFINDNTAPDDTISVLNNQCVVYLFTDRDSASKYIYQTRGDISPKIKMEYASDLQKMQPELLVIPLDSSYEYISEHIFGMINVGYYEYFVSDRHIVYKRK